MLPRLIQPINIAYRTGRNPNTGEEIPITARRVVTFRPGQKFKARIEAYVGPKQPSADAAGSGGPARHSLTEHARSWPVGITRQRAPHHQGGRPEAGVAAGGPGDAPRATG